MYYPKSLLLLGGFLPFFFLGVPLSSLNLAFSPCVHLSELVLFLLLVHLSQHSHLAPSFA